MSSYSVTWITSSLSVGRAPMSYAELESIKTQGIDAIVNLCAEFSDLHELEESSGFEVCYLPIWDEDIPKIEAMEDALAWLDEAIYLGKKVLVHCRHGIGRTGTFVTSYMIRRGHTLKAASKKLKSSKANPSNYGQWKLLKKYGKKSGILKIREPSLEIKNRVDLSLFFSDYESLIKKIDQEINNQKKNRRAEEGSSQCGKQDQACCSKPFNIPFIEVVYLHSKMNRHFTSSQRDILIKRAVETYKNGNKLCLFNKGDGCEAFSIRPIRCRIFKVHEIAKDRNEIQNMLFEISQAVFLAFAGEFQPEMNFTFSMADTISGKFVQKYFHYMSEFKKT
ncbi:MAG: dual specificity protein phosphatase family protein [Desulfobacula sp.]|nr:dual specificity protein phosphatase family protein [Desulfobacula sp.]